MADLPPSDVPGRTLAQPRPAGSGASPRPADHRGYSVYAEEGVSAWAWFTGALMGLVGLFQLITGIVALASPSYYSVPTRSLVVDASYTTWGWVHLIIGILALGAGGGIAFGNTIARVVGVALAAVSVLVNITFLPAAPFAAVAIIALDVFLIYAITVHVGEAKRAR